MQNCIQSFKNKKDIKIYGLRYDTIFKNMFRKKEYLKQFFKDAFQENLEDFWYIDKELSKENKNLRYRISDLVIKTEKRIIIVELQNKNLENIEPRSKMYISGFYMRQNPGKFYEHVKPVELYLILNYPYQSSEVLKEYEEINRNRDEQFGNLSKIKIWNIYEALKKRNGIDYDYARIFNLDRLGKKVVTKTLLELEEKKTFQSFIENIKYYNMDYKIYQKLKEEESMEMSFEQATSMIKYHAEQRGEKRGKKEGIMVGKLETAFSMLKKGIDLPFIKEITGLTDSQIKEYVTKRKN